MTPQADSASTSAKVAAWITPRSAAIVVAIVALCLVGVVAIAVLQLQPGEGTPPVADPNASTIAALASAAIASLTSLAAAYFGIKVASEQSAQSAATAATAVRLLGDSTSNGNPPPPE